MPSAHATSVQLNLGRGQLACVRAHGGLEAASCHERRLTQPCGARHQPHTACCCLTSGTAPPCTLRSAAHLRPALLLAPPEASAQAAACFPPASCPTLPGCAPHLRPLSQPAADSVKKSGQSQPLCESCAHEKTARRDGAMTCTAVGWLQFGVYQQLWVVTRQQYAAANSC